MGLIKDFLRSQGLWKSGELSKEWDRRKKWFQGSDYRPPIDVLLKYYRANVEKEFMQRALKKGIPAYE